MMPANPRMLEKEKWALICIVVGSSCFTLGYVIGKFLGDF